MSLPIIPTPSAPTRPSSWDRVASQQGFATFSVDGAMGQWIDPIGRPPMDRSTSTPTAQLQWAGTAAQQAIEAAQHIARRPVDASFTNGDGDVARVSFNPAVAVLHDPGTGYWIAPLETTLEYDDVDMPIPHAIDGSSVGSEIEFLGVTSNLDALHYVVGRDDVIDLTRK